VDANDPLSCAQQRFDEIRADEPGSTRDQPASIDALQQGDVRLTPGLGAGVARLAAACASDCAHSLHRRIPARSTRCGSNEDFTSTNTAPGCSFAAIASTPSSRYCACDTATTTAAPFGSASHCSSATPYSCIASPGSATASCTC